MMNATHQFQIVIDFAHWHQTAIDIKNRGSLSLVHWDNCNVKAQLDQICTKTWSLIWTLAMLFRCKSTFDASWSCIHQGWGLQSTERRAAHLSNSKSIWGPYSTDATFSLSVGTQIETFAADGLATACVTVFHSMNVFYGEFLQHLVVGDAAEM